MGFSHLLLISYGACANEISLGALVEFIMEALAVRMVGIPICDTVHITKSAVRGAHVCLLAIIASNAGLPF